MKLLPKVRLENIVVQELEKELLIYDLISNKAFYLNETAKIVWRACLGESSERELICPNEFSDELIWLTLEQLSRADLMEKPVEIGKTFNGLSRREVIRKVGISSMIALPLISSIAAPGAAQAQSGCSGLGVGCSDNSQCCANNCRGQLSSTAVPPRCCVSTAFEAAEPGIGFCSSVNQPLTCQQAGLIACCSGLATQIAPIPNCVGSGDTCLCSPFP